MPVGQSYFGAAYDGKFVYFSPRNGGQLLRYDPTLAFAPPLPALDLSSFVAGTSYGFSGVIVAAGALYLAPTGGCPDAVRYPPDAAFSVDGVERFTLAPDDAGPTPWHNGAVYDGHYVYLVPHQGTTPGGAIPEPTIPGATTRIQPFEQRRGIEHLRPRHARRRRLQLP